MVYIQYRNKTHSQKQKRIILGGKCHSIRFQIWDYEREIFVFLKCRRRCIVFSIIIITSDEFNKINIECLLCACLCVAKESVYKKDRLRDLSSMCHRISSCVCVCVCVAGTYDWEFIMLCILKIVVYCSDNIYW